MFDDEALPECLDQLRAAQAERDRLRALVDVGAARLTAAETERSEREGVALLNEATANTWEERCIAAEARVEAAEQALRETQTDSQGYPLFPPKRTEGACREALRQIAEGTWNRKDGGFLSAREFARAALACPPPEEEK